MSAGVWAFDAPPPHAHPRIPPHPMRSIALVAAFLLPAFGLGGSAHAQSALADRIEDLRRTAAVRAALAEDTQTRPYDVGVTTEAGVVTLVGVVGTMGARERAEALAGAVRGIRLVQNSLRIEGQPDLPVTRSVAAPPEATGEEQNEPPPVADEPEAQAEPEASAAQPVYHTVRSGDTLYAIARRYGTTVQALQRLNDLRSNDIRIGRRLRVR